ncbi:TadE/TadG family type IV pilus assembly protein [Yoonia sp. R2-816]
MERKVLGLLQKFSKEESGSVSVELLFVVPILFWTLMSTFVFFDAYRAEAISTRAGLTIADMYSRETDPITPAYLNGTRQLLRSLTEAEADPDFRVTAYQYFETDDEYRVIWSRNRGMTPNYNDARFANIRNRVPDLSDGEVAILVETRTQYTAPFTSAIAPFDVDSLREIEFNTFVFISPRPIQVCWQQTSTSDQLCDRFSG